MTQRCTRYFFLLNLFGFFFLSAQALAAEPVAGGEGCTSSTCALSCSSVESKPTLAFHYDLQPILGAALSRIESDELVSERSAEIFAAHVEPALSIPTLAVAPKQSPPSFA